MSQLTRERRRPGVALSVRRPRFPLRPRAAAELPEGLWLDSFGPRSRCVFHVWLFCCVKEDLFCMHGLCLRSQSSGSLVSKRLSFRDCQRCAARVPIRCDDDALLSWHLKTLEEPKQATVPARLSQKLRRAEVFWGAVHLRQHLQGAAPPSLRLLLRRHIRIATVSSLFLREERKAPGPRWCKSHACILESYMESLAVVKGQSYGWFSLAELMTVPGAFALWREAFLAAGIQA